LDFLRFGKFGKAWSRGNLLRGKLVRFGLVLKFRRSGCFRADLKSGETLVKRGLTGEIRFVPAEKS
jgi:hypothetical protein